MTEPELIHEIAPGQPKKRKNIRTMQFAGTELKTRTRQIKLMVKLCKIEYLKLKKKESLK